MTEQYTKDDFKRAEFARHPDGRVAARNGFAYAPWWVRLPAGDSEGRSGDVMAAEGWVPVPAGSYTRTDEDGLTLLMVQQQRDQATARAEKAERERDRLRDMCRAWEKTSNRVCDERDQLKEKLRSAEQGRDEIREMWFTATRSLSDANLTIAALRAEQPRPLTADDVERALAAAVESWRTSYPPEDQPYETWKTKQATWSALRVLGLIPTEPTRPEGAYELETVIGCNAGKWTNGPEDVRALADLLASKSVRVTGGE